MNINGPMDEVEKEKQMRLKELDKSNNKRKEAELR